jgi:large subunit ribosomal protein LX
VKTLVHEIKIFRIKGEIRKPELHTNFVKEVRALKEKDAIEQIYKHLGSRHRVRRYHIHITSVDEIKPEEATDNIVIELTEAK